MGKKGNYCVNRIHLKYTNVCSYTKTAFLCNMTIKKSARMLDPRNERYPGGGLMGLLVVSI